MRLKFVDLDDLNVKGLSEQPRGVVLPPLVVNCISLSPDLFADKASEKLRQVTDAMEKGVRVMLINCPAESCSELVKRGIDTGGHVIPLLTREFTDPYWLGIAGGTVASELNKVLFEESIQPSGRPPAQKKAKPLSSVVVDVLKKNPWLFGCVNEQWRPRVSFSLCKDTQDIRPNLFEEEIRTYFSVATTNKHVCLLSGLHADRHIASALLVERVALEPRHAEMLRRIAAQWGRLLREKRIRPEALASFSAYGRLVCGKMIEDGQGHRPIGISLGSYLSPLPEQGTEVLKCRVYFLDDVIGSGGLYLRVKEMVDDAGGTLEGAGFILATNADVVQTHNVHVLSLDANVHVHKPWSETGCVLCEKEKELEYVSERTLRLYRRKSRPGKSFLDDKERFWKWVDALKALKEHKHKGPDGDHHFLYFDTVNLIRHYGDRIATSLVRKLWSLLKTSEKEQSTEAKERTIPQGIQTIFISMSKGFGAPELCSSVVAAFGPLPGGVTATALSQRDDGELDVEATLDWNNLGGQLILVDDTINTGETLHKALRAIRGRGYSDDVIVLVLLNRLSERQQAEFEQKGVRICSIMDFRVPVYKGSDRYECPACQRKTALREESEKIKRSRGDHPANKWRELVESHGNRQKPLAAFEAKIHRLRGYEGIHPFVDLLEELSPEQLICFLGCLSPLELRREQGLSEALTARIQKSPALCYNTSFLLNFARLPSQPRGSRATARLLVEEMLSKGEVQLVDDLAPIAVKACLFPEWASALDAELSAVHDRISEAELSPEDRRQRMRVLAKFESLFHFEFLGLIGCGPDHEKLLDRAKRFAGSLHPVLIIGGSGTGKELLAKGIHGQSPRRAGPFRVVNIGSLPPHLADSELFGHKKGAYTGAYQHRVGMLEEANGGTVFLDEVGDAPMETQIKLLRFLQDRTFTRLGDNRVRRSDVRIIAATNRDLQRMTQEVDQGKPAFREDLFYRLNVLPIRMPAFREIGEKTPVIERLWQKVLSEEGRRLELSDEARALIECQIWPGNYRELENFMRRLVLLLDDRGMVSGELAEAELRYWGVREVPVSEQLLPTTNLDELEERAVKQAHAKDKRTKEVAKAIGRSQGTCRTLIKKYIKEEVSGKEVAG